MKQFLIFSSLVLAIVLFGSPLFAGSSKKYTHADYLAARQQADAAQVIYNAATARLVQEEAAVKTAGTNCYAGFDNLGAKVAALEVEANDLALKNKLTRADANIKKKYNAKLAELETTKNQRKLKEAECKAAKTRFEGQIQTLRINVEDFKKQLAAAQLNLVDIIRLCPGCTNLQSVACGNGVIDAGEHCDDGNTEDGDGCPSNCILPCPPSIVAIPSAAARYCPNICGNGIVDGGEECDDGNTTDGDRCSSVCLLECPTLCWEDRYDSGFNDSAKAIALNVASRDSGIQNVYVGGGNNSNRSNLEGNIWLRKYDNCGRIIWTHIYEPLDHTISDAFDATIGLDGHLYTLASIGTYPSFNIGLFKFDSGSGGELFPSPIIERLIGSGNENENGIATDHSTGHVYMVGRSLDDWGDVVITSYKADGTLRWSRQTTGTSPVVSNDITVINGVVSKGIYVTGNVYGRPSQRIWVAKFDLEGSLVWQRIVDLGPSVVESAGNAISYDRLSNFIYVAGYYVVDAGVPILPSYSWIGVFRPDDGTLETTWSYDGPGVDMPGFYGDEFRDIFVSNNSIYVIGTEETGGSTRDIGGGILDYGDESVWQSIIVKKLNVDTSVSPPLFTETWSYSYGSADTGSKGNGIVADVFGNVYITGAVGGGLFRDSITTFDIWVKSFPPSGPSACSTEAP